MRESNILEIATRCVCLAVIVTDTDDDDDDEYIETVETIINGKCFLKCITGEIYDRDTHEFIGYYLQETNTIA